MAKNVYNKIRRNFIGIEMTDGPNPTNLIELHKIAQKYGFNDILQFSAWVEDNDLGEILFGKDQEEIDNGKENIDKDSMRYKSTTLALDILSLPEVKNADLDKITFDQWLKWSRKARNRRKNV